jgi:hypothetical protein
MSVNKAFVLASVPRGAGPLWPLLNRKILDVAQLRLRFCSIFATKSASKSGAIPNRLIYGQALNQGRFFVNPVSSVWKKKVDRR